MRASDEIKKVIGEMEGCKLDAYKPLPTDRYTIGYGTTFYEDGSPVLEGDNITQDHADELLSDRIDDIASQLSANPSIPDKVTQNEFDAVVSLAYNIGVSAFKNSTTGNMFYMDEDISKKFPEWNRSGGKPVPGLTVRRLREQTIYMTGDYEDDHKYN